MNVFLSFLTEQSFHLVVCESEERLYMSLGKKYLGSCRHVLPGFGRKLKGNKQKMQSRGISLGGESGPFSQCVETDINVRRSIAANLATGGENEVFLAFKPQN